MKTAIIGFALAGLASAQAFAFTTSGKYKIVSATAVVDISGNIRCVSTMSFNTFGKVGETVDVSITNSEVILSQGAGEYVDLTNAPFTHGDGSGAGYDPTDIAAQFGATSDVFTITDEEIPTLPVTVTVTLKGNTLEYTNHSTSSGKTDVCVLQQVN